MSLRDDIVNLALTWPDQGDYKPSADELISFFSDAQINAPTAEVPTESQAQRSLAPLPQGGLSTGCYSGPANLVKQWCGIFACSVAVNAGLNGVWWDVNSGYIKGAQVLKIYGVPVSNPAI